MAASVTNNLKNCTNLNSYLYRVKVFKNGTSKICGRQSLKNFTWSILEYLDPYIFVLPCIY